MAFPLSPKAIARVACALVLLAFMLVGTHAAHAATLSVSPSSSVVSAGKTFTERIVVSSSDQAMNAAAGTLSFPTDLVQVVGVSKGATFTLWVQDPTYSNGAGTVSFSGGLPNPGYQGSGATVVSITFLALKAGSGTLSFSSPQVLANDGQGTNILTSAPGGSFTITEAAATPPPTTKPTKPVTTEPTKPSSVGPLGLTSSTHPDQNAWYSKRSILVSWNNPSSVTQVRTGYDSDPDGVPTKVYTAPVSERAIDGDTGVTYFHLQVRDSNGWGPVTSYRFNIDTDAPTAPSVSYTRGIPPLLSFSSTDELSGVYGYEVRVNDGEPVSVSTTSSSFELGRLPQGANTIEVAALDFAGNRATTSSSVVLLTSGTPGWITFLWHLLTYSSPILLLLLLLAALAYLGWYLWGKFTTVRVHSARRSQAVSRSLSEQFTDLRDSLTEEEGALAELTTIRELTLEERRFFKRFTTQLDKAEALLSRNLTRDSE